MAEPTDKAPHLRRACREWRLMGVLAGASSVGHWSLLHRASSPAGCAEEGAGAPASSHAARPFRATVTSISRHWLFTTPRVPGNSCSPATRAIKKVGNEIALAPVDYAGSARLIDLPRSVLEAFRQRSRRRPDSSSPPWAGEVTATCRSLMPVLSRTSTSRRLGDSTAGEPNTPWYVGKSPPKLDLIMRKREAAGAAPILFEHWAIARPRR